jgi:HEAT repeat protein
MRKRRLFMGEIGLKPLILALTHKDRKTRRLVESALDESISAHQAEAVESLLWVLQESLHGFDRLTSEARIQVAKLLSKIGDPQTAIPLVGSYEDLSQTYLEIPDNQRKACEPVWRKYRETVAQVLKEIGKPAADAMVREIMDKTTSVSASSILHMLGNMGEPAVEALIEALKHPNRSIRRQAADALRMNPDTRAVEPLVAALDDPNNRVRSTAAAALRALKAPGAGAALARRLRDKDHEVRVAAALALQDLSWIPADDEEMVYLLFAGFLASQAQVIFDKLVGLGSAAVQPLIKSLGLKGKVYTATWGRRSSPIERQASEPAIWLLREIGKPAVEPLIEALKHNNRNIRCNAARTLGEIRDSRAKEALTKALEDKDEHVREAAKKALKRLRKPWRTRMNTSERPRKRPSRGSENEKHGNC